MNDAKLYTIGLKEFYKNSLKETADVIPRHEGSVELVVISTKEKSVELLCYAQADPSYLGMTENSIYAIKPNSASYLHILNFNTLHKIERHDFETSYPN